MEVQNQEVLQNADQQKEHFYDWPDDFLQRILGAMLCDPYFLLQSYNLIKPEYFRDKAHGFICSTIIKYYNDYKAAPDRTIIRASIKEKLGDDPIHHYYFAELDAIYDFYRPGVEQREIFLDKITEFAKTQALRLAYTNTLDIFKQNKKNKWDSIREILSQALQVDRNVDLGLDYFETVEERYQRVMETKAKKDYFFTGFAEIDQCLEGGLSRGEIGAFAGLSNSGKSLNLVKAGKVNLLNGRNVLYISLEMEEDKIAERFDAMLTNIPIRSLYYNKHPDQVRDILDENKNGCGKLVIKQFPAGTVDVTNCRALISQLHLHGFYPDLVIVDYVGEMKDIPGIKTYESRQKLVRDLRGMAVELQICVLTAMQINRGGRDMLKEQDFLDESALADSAGQVRPLDALWTISQTEVEQKANCGTVFISKHRSGKSRFGIKFYRDPHTLEMHQISIDKWKQECSKVSDKIAEELVMSDYANESWQPNKGSNNKKESHEN